MLWWRLETDFGSASESSPAMLLADGPLSVLALTLC